METRLPPTVPNSLKIYAGKTVKSHKIKEEVQTGFICRSENGHMTYQHENETVKNIRSMAYLQHTLETVKG